MAREERQDSNRKRRRRRRRRSTPGIMPAVIVVLAVLLIVGIFVGRMLWAKYSPSKEMANGNEYFGLADDQAMAVIINTELLEDQARLIDGEVYLNVETVYQYLNNRFYWDATENQYLYALPTDLVTAQVGSNEYQVSKEKQSKDYTIIRADGADAYVAIDFIKDYTNLTYEYWEEPNHIQIFTEFTQRDVVTAQKDCAVRWKAGIKSEILTKVPKGTSMYVLEEPEEIDEWTRVLTKDGYIGYVQDKYLSIISQEGMEEPAFSEPEYTSISKDYTINLAWHQVTSMEANNTLLDYIADTKGLTTISPTWFSIADTDGNIRSIASQEYVNRAHQQGLEVWGLVDNFTEGVSTYETLSKTSSRQRLVNQLVAAAIQYGLDGINVDFELITPECGRAYIQFIRELSIMCRINGIILSVDSYVPTASSTQYFRAEQGVFVDYVIIMGYDEHYAGSEEAGSVASYGYVQSGIENALEEVPNEKLIIGIPFYTRFWKTDENGEVSSEALGMDGADTKVRNNNAEAVWDEETHQYYVEFNYNNCLYQMWLEEERSIEEKLQLMKGNNLAGVAEWKLGFERSSIWDVILKYVN